MTGGERVSLVATVLNEAESIGPWLASLRAQTRTPDEVVLVDGGSSDGTLERLLAAAADWPELVVHSEPGATISRGRNVAIERATGSIVAATDAGTQLPPDWLHELVAPLERDPALGVSAGFFRAEGPTFLAQCIGTVTMPHLREIDPTRFLPSSRSVAFRKEWWRRAGGYPSWLRTGEDLVFDLALKRAGAPFAFAPDAVAVWRPPESLGGFYRQYWHYARGDGHANLWPKRHAARYGAYAAGLALLRAGRRRHWPRLALAAGVGVHLRRYVARVRLGRPFADRRHAAAAYVLVPVIVVTGDLAKMAGYPRGVVERLRVRRREELEQLPIRPHRAPVRRA